MNTSRVLFPVFSIVAGLLAFEGSASARLKMPWEFVSDGSLCLKKNLREAHDKCKQAMKEKGVGGALKYSQCKVCNGCSISPGWALYARTGQTCMAVVKQDEKMVADYAEAQKLCGDLKSYFGECKVESGPTCSGSPIRVKKIGKFVVCVPKPGKNNKGGKCGGSRDYVKDASFTASKYPKCSFKKNKGKPVGGKYCSETSFVSCDLGAGTCKAVKDFGNGEDKVKANAKGIFWIHPFYKYQHCATSCVLSHRCGKVWAGVLGIAREVLSMLDLELRKQNGLGTGDEIANQTGRKLSGQASSDGECLSLCYGIYPK
jgi:hypothetical protein